MVLFEGNRERQGVTGSPLLKLVFSRYLKVQP